MSETPNIHDLLLSQHDFIVQRMNSLDSKISEISTKLVDPEVGLIVKVNQNAESHRQLASQFSDYPIVKQEVQTFTKWRKNANRVFWIFITAAVAFFSDIFHKIFG